MEKNNIMEDDNFSDAVISVFKRYLPKRVVEKIMSNPSTIKVEGEKRFATILFGDLSGFTALTEKLQDPEKIVVIINRYFKRMLEIVEKYGGDVDKFLGDAIMVIFGAPVAHSNDPERACRAALEMIQAIKEIGVVHTPKGDVKVNMSIGVNTGDIVSLNMGSDERMEYTVMGDNVNLSSRLEGVAKGGEIIISDRTYKYVKEIFDVKTLEPVKVKGKEKPIPIYLLKSAKSHLKLEESTFFDREDKLVELRGVYDDLRNGKGVTLLIKGDEGVGKTSLILSSQRELSGIRIIHLKAYPYSKKMVYNPLIEWIKSEYGSSVPEILSDKSTEKKGGMLKKWDRFIAEISKVSPILIFLEDAHNCDEETIALLKELFNVHKSHLSLILETHKDIKIKSSHKTMTLENFSFDKALGFIKEVKSLKDIDIVLSKKIFTLTGGNPFFIKEILNFLEEGNVIYSRKGTLTAKKSFYSMKLPPTVRSLIMEKVDEIPEGIKTLLQFASVFGKPFAEKDIVMTFGMSKEKIKRYLKNAVELGYLGISKDRYEIVSETLKEVLDDSLFKQRKKELHLSIAKYLEEEYKDIRQDIYDALAYHYEQAGIKEKASTYLIQAGIRAKVMYANLTALELFIRAEKVLKRMHKPDLMFKTLLNVGEVLLNIGKRAEAEKYFARALKWAEKVGEIPKAKTYNLIGEIYGASGEMKKAVKYTEKAMKIYRDKEDKDGLSVVLNNAGELQFKLSKYNDALRYFKEALDISLIMNAFARSALIYYRMGRIYDIMGNFDRALDFYKNAVEIYENLEDKEGLAYVYSNLGAMYIALGKYDEAEEYLKIAIKDGKEMDNSQIFVLSELNLGVVKFYKGKLDAAQEHYENALETSKKIEDKATELQSLANIAEIMEKKGDMKNAMKYYEDVRDMAKDVGNKYIYIYALLKIGILYYQMGEYDKSITVLDESVENALKLNLEGLYYQSLLTIIRVYMKLGFYDRAMEIFKKFPSDITIPEIKGEMLELKGEFYLLSGNINEVTDAIRSLKILVESGDNTEMLLKYYNLKINYLMWKGNTKGLGGFVQEVENIINGMNYWSRESESIFLSLARYFLSVNDYTSALSLARMVKENAEEREAKEDLINALIIEGEIYSELKGEREALKSFENAAHLTYEIYQGICIEYRDRFFNIRKRIFPFQSAFSLYLKKRNLPLLLKFLSNVPEEILNPLLDFGNKLNPALVSQARKYLNK